MQARALPYKARVSHYNVMNATSDSESDWFYNESSCVEVWSTDLQQIRELGSIESDTMAAIQEGKVTFVPFAFLYNFVCFTDNVHLNSEQLFKDCFTEDGMNFFLSEHTGTKPR